MGHILWLNDSSNKQLKECLQQQEAVSMYIWAWEYIGHILWKSAWNMSTLHLVELLIDMKEGIDVKVGISFVLTIKKNRKIQM